MSRLVDAGAVFAGWVGLGVALVAVIALALVIAIQGLVFLLALPIGLLLGWYANARSERRRPRWRVLANSAYAGLVTAVGLAVMYVGLRLLFVYADTGAMPDGGRLDCRMGPECTYARHIEAGQGDQLAEQGVTDARSFEAAVLREQVLATGALFGLTLGGSLASGALLALRGRPAATRTPVLSEAE
ncbi:MAG TPA: hypothetical protein VMP67_08375 [Candidatus Limnocylindria bacterium]|nr:hypothetical protein [Candidatus Limnocylindria bacterium]